MPEFKSKLEPRLPLLFQRQAPCVPILSARSAEELSLIPYLVHTFKTVQEDENSIAECLRDLTTRIAKLENLQVMKPKTPRFGVPV